MNNNTLSPGQLSEVSRLIERLAARLVMVDDGAGSLPADISAERALVVDALRSAAAFPVAGQVMETAHTVESLTRAVEQLQAEIAGFSSKPDNSLSRDPELVNDFLLESKEYLAAIEATLLRVEENPADAEAIHTMFRAFHTIKGLAGFLEYAAIQQTAHEVESVLDLVRGSKLTVSSHTVNAILAAKDYLANSLDTIEKRGADLPVDPALISRIQMLSSSQREEEPVASLAALSQVAVEREQVEPAKPVVRESRSVKVDTGKLDALVDMVGEMVIAQSLIRHDPDLMSLDRPRLSRNINQLARITDEVQKTAMSMRMVPVRGLFQKMSRLVRDLGMKSGKKVVLRSEGEETELDRNIVEELADPLMHMVRNAMDHGIESPAERAAAGKPEEGRIELRARHQSGRILIEIADDGRGLNTGKILQKARAVGLVAEADRPEDSEIFNLIFQPGFSTADKVTDVSGRGVGMDVVRRQIAKLRGRIEICSLPGQGTTFSIKLPLTLAIIDGLVVACGKEKFIVPLAIVREVLQPGDGMLFTVEGRNEMVLVRGKLLPMLRLCRHFGIEPRSEDARDGILVVVESDARRFCVLIDELIGKQEVVIKALGDLFKGVRGLAGGAILGDGRIGLVLDAEALGGGGPLG